jgi:HSP20 family molecular chaperone IbpA
MLTFFQPNFYTPSLLGRRRRRSYFDRGLLGRSAFSGFSFPDEAFFDPFDELTDAFEDAFSGVFLREPSTESRLESQNQPAEGKHQSGQSHAKRIKIAHVNGKHAKAVVNKQLKVNSAKTTEASTKKEQKRAPKAVSIQVTPDAAQKAEATKRTEGNKKTPLKIVEKEVERKNETKSAPASIDKSYSSKDLATRETFDPFPHDFDLSLTKTEDSKNHIFSMAVPELVDTKDLTVNVNGDSATISGTLEKKGNGCYSRSSFSRTFPLPAGLDVDSIVATRENGKLSLNAPKSAPVSQ